MPPSASSSASPSATFRRSSRASRCSRATSPPPASPPSPPSAPPSATTPASRSPSPRYASARRPASAPASPTRHTAPSASPTSTRCTSPRAASGRGAPSSAAKTRGPASSAAPWPRAGPTRCGVISPPVECGERPVGRPPRHAATVAKPSEARHSVLHFVNDPLGLRRARALKSPAQKHFSACATFGTSIALSGPGGASARPEEGRHQAVNIVAHCACTAPSDRRRGVADPGHSGLAGRPRSTAWISVPQIAVFAFAAMLGAHLARFVRSRRPLPAGAVGALVASFLALDTAGSGGPADLHFATAGMLLALGTVLEAPPVFHFDIVTGLTASLEFKKMVRRPPRL